MQLNLPVNRDSKQSSVGGHVHYVFCPVSEGERTGFFNIFLVLEMSSYDINETLYL